MQLRPGVRLAAAVVLLPVALAALLGCGTSPAPGADGGAPAGPSAWQVVYDGQGLGRALVTAWGTGAGDVLLGGGPLGNRGLEALVLRFDGASWTDLAPGGPDGFWWIHGSSATDVWLVGERGRIAHWDGSAFRELARPTTATLWGVWAASPTDAWAVGGTPGAGPGAPNDVLLHWDGATWSPETLPGKPLGRALFKVWGTSSSDLYAVGEAATIWHRTGTTWRLEPNPGRSTLFTVTGCSSTEVYAVGGDDVLRSDGATWSKVTVALTNQVNGVACASPGEVLLVGFGGLKERLVDGTWVDEFAVEPYGDLHGSWADGATGTFWAVGGDFLSKPKAGQPRKATIARYGPGTVPSPAP